MEKGKVKDKANREYKNSVFVDLFSLEEMTRKEAVVSFYNALHEEKITYKDEVKFVHLENVLFRKVRNDVSFIVNNRLVVLLEHQSTINPNMPFRFLEYIVAVYQTQLEPRLKFAQTKINLPEPEFYVIYNGRTPYPMRKQLCISDLFKTNKKHSQLELIVTVININHPDSKYFLDFCPLLNGYKKLTEMIEKYKALYGNECYAMAIEECIKENIEISEYLKYKMREVMEMLTAEYSYALELEASRKDGIMEGKKEGKKEGKREGKREGLLATANRMKKANFDIDTIVEMTGLSRQIVEEL